MECFSPFPNEIYISTILGLIDSWKKRLFCERAGDVISFAGTAVLSDFLYTVCHRGMLLFTPLFLFITNKADNIDRFSMVDRVITILSFCVHLPLMQVKLPPISSSYKGNGGLIQIFCANPSMH